MSTRSDGGAAFPEQVVHSEEHGFMTASAFSGNEGLSKRDWFAGHALSGVMSGAQGIGQLPKNARAAMLSQVADLIYEMADAMLAARSKPKAQEGNSE